MNTKKVLIVYAHPEPKSMNNALFQAAISAFISAGHKVQTSDLYSMAFNPVSHRHNFTSVKDDAFYKQQAEETYATEVNGFAPDIEEEIQKVEWCDLMIWQFPLWWFSVPGILKGWVDRVFAMGRTYGYGRLYENGAFKSKKALLSITIGGAREAYLPGGFNGDLMGILRPLHRGVLEFTGFTVLKPYVVYGPARQSRKELEGVLKVYEERLLTVWDEAPLEVGSY